MTIGLIFWAQITRHRPREFGGGQVRATPRPPHPGECRGIHPHPRPLPKFGSGAGRPFPPPPAPGRGLRNSSPPIPRPLPSPQIRGGKGENFSWGRFVALQRHKSPPNPRFLAAFAGFGCFAAQKRRKTPEILSPLPLGGVGGGEFWACPPLSPQGRGWAVFGNCAPRVVLQGRTGTATSTRRWVLVSYGQQVMRVRRSSSEGLIQRAFSSRTARLWPRSGRIMRLTMT
jgi:hypothetical protein